MRLIKPSFEIIEQEFPVCESENQHKEALLDAMYKHIELCGRTCYKSTDKITETSAKPFVDRMINSQHYAMLEHGTIYLKVPGFSSVSEFGMVMYNNFTKGDYSKNSYSKQNNITVPYKLTKEQKEFVSSVEVPYYYITTNLRVIIENGWENDLQYICAPTKHHAKRHTVKFICNRQVSHEFVRHRVFSFAQESTRCLIIAT